MTNPASLSVAETIIEIPETWHCSRHGSFVILDWYDEEEVLDMLEEWQTIFCPYCMAECVGTE